MQTIWTQTTGMSRSSKFNYLLIDKTNSFSNVIVLLSDFPKLLISNANTASPLPTRPHTIAVIPAQNIPSNGHVSFLAYEIKDHI